MAISQLGYLGFGVDNVDEWIKFANDVVGLEVTETAEDGTVYLRMDENHHRIALHPGGTGDLSYVGLQTANREEFEKTKESLFSAGVEFAQASPSEISNRMVRDMVKFKASGVPLEVYYGPKVLFEKPFLPTARISGFRTGELGMGHIGVAPDDADEIIHVLLDGLGFKTSDSLGGDERFFHCNGREHTFVVGRPGASDGKRIGHFMLELNSIDDVGSCLDRVEDSGVEVTSRLGKNTNDHMISFYMKTPSGFRMEYGWNGRVVNDEDWQVNIYNRASIWGHRPPSGRRPDQAPTASFR